MKASEQKERMDIMHKLHYKQEALAWTEALPMGNGRIGAMAFSGVLSERYDFNEETLWSGYPHDRSRPEAAQYVPEVKKLIAEKKFLEANRLIEEKMIHTEASTYLPFSSIRVDMKKRLDFTIGCAPGYSVLTPHEISDYSRELDMKTGVVSSSFTYNGNKISRRAFVSHPDNVFVEEIRSSEEGNLHFDLRANCALDHMVKSGNRFFTITGKCPVEVWHGIHAFDPDACVHEYDYEKDTIPFCSTVKVLTDGTCITAGGVIFVCNATYATIFVAIRTGYTAWNESPSANSLAYAEACAEDIRLASEKPFEELLARHTEDHAALYNRCEISIGEADARPTNELLDAAKTEFPSALAALMFHYSRYLLIAASREGTQPTNLQGIWNSEVLPPWRSDYTVNINTQMNYWSAEMSALPECHMPLFPFIKDMAEAGKTSAKNHFAADGWVLCHNTDVWRMTSPAGIKARYAYWPMAGLWFCRHIWEHYDYTKDTAFLEEYFDVLVGALDFLNSWLYENEDGYLTTVCSVSPENIYTIDGEEAAVSGISSMDIGIILDFTEYTAKICDILGNKTDIKNRCDYIRTHLSPYKIGSDGRLLEWSEELTEPEPGHRHISHLYGLHPGTSIRPGSPFFDACRKSLETRLANGGGYTGWSNAWIINQFARMQNGESAYKYVKNMFRVSTYYNLFDAHPPFQIDGNFGFASGLGEMLMQSFGNDLTLLPAISCEMNKGSVRGMRARGGYDVSFAWDNGKITSYTVSKNGITVLSGGEVPYPFTITLP